MGLIRILLACLIAAGLLSAQTYDLLLKGGHLIDPANSIDRVMDVAVSGDKIARVAESIPAGQAKTPVDVTGLYVTPGLVDIHTHVYAKGRASTLFPDDTSLLAGTTTVVEAGRLTGKPVMVDLNIQSNSGRTTREKLLDIMRPGDIHTHMYNDMHLEMLDRFTGKLQPYMLEARRRGVIFDMGHG